MSSLSDLIRNSNVNAGMTAHVMPAVRSSVVLLVTAALEQAAVAQGVLVPNPWTKDVPPTIPALDFILNDGVVLPDLEARFEAEDLHISSLAVGASFLATSLASSAAGALSPVLWSERLDLTAGLSASRGSLVWSGFSEPSQIIHSCLTIGS